MASTKATTVAKYLKELPADRRKTIAAVRDMIRKHLPSGYKETMNWGMICYEIPLSTYPDTYNQQPLMFAALAAQKNYSAIYLMCVYSDPKREKQLRDAFTKADKKLDMGKSCIRFKTVEDLPLPAIGKIIASTTPKAFIKAYEASRKK